MLETILLPMSQVLRRMKQKLCCRCHWYLVHVPWDLFALGSAIAQLLQYCYDRFSGELPIVSFSQSGWELLCSPS